MARKRWVDGKLRVYSAWFDEKIFDYSIFDSKKAILDWFKSNNYRNSSHNLVVEFLIDYIRKNNFKNVVSFGAGTCAMECLIKQALPDVNIVATEYETHLVEIVKPFFKDITVVPFDLFKDDIGVLEKKCCTHFDFAFFSASAYVMDDSHFLRVFKKLNELGVYDVVDNSGGVVDDKRCLGWFMYRVYNSIYYLLNEELKYDLKYIPVNRPYGYGRTIPDLRRLYNKAGYDVIDEQSLGNIPYLSILKSKNNGI